MIDPDDSEPREPFSDAAPDSAADATGGQVAGIRRAVGVTGAERYLQRLCDHSFMRLWSYPGVYRDQGVGKSGDGKEICDLLVVFGQHLIIFSDKDCAFPATGNLERDWSRWFRRAVAKSADQVYGAERWLLDYPQRVYLDRRCTVPFPIALPSRDVAVIHRIVVAHAASARCRLEQGGTGSLMIMPAITGPDHYRYPDGPVMPFAIGDVDPSRGYVHVLDDQSLNVLLETLDTIADFTDYLTAKELFFRSGRLGGATGEDDLLALYLKRADADGRHRFVLPGEEDHTIFVPEGHWEEFKINPQRLAQIDANRVSYAWDELIEVFSGHLLAGTSEFRSHKSLRDMEPLLRCMAAEPRTRRRMLAKDLLGFIDGGRPDGDAPRARVVAPGPNAHGFRHYVWVTLAQRAGKSYEEYRELRRGILEAYVLVTRLLNPDAISVLGIATEPGLRTKPRSEDALLIESSNWTPELEAVAKRWHEEVGLLRTVRRSEVRASEYPEPTS
jgi:hypothetical protein